MTIRPIQRDDHAVWLQMRRALWPDCAEEMHALEIELYDRHPHDVAVFVVDCGTEWLGGFVELSVRDRVDGSMSERVGYVEGWYVAPELRGQGIGRRLIEAAERWTVERGLTELASDVEIDNEGSLRAHAALGFNETFRIVQFLKRVGPHSSESGRVRTPADSSFCREATVDDLPALAALDRDVFGHEAYPPFFFRQALDLWGPTFLVAEAEARPVAGYALAAPSVRAGEACILSMGVHPSCRGQGLATGLLGALLDRLGAAGMEVVWLTVHPQNVGAMRLYRGAGFVAVEEEAEYFGSGEPRVRMERRLG